MRIWAKVGIGMAVVVVPVSLALAVLSPILVREARRVAGPIQRMKRSQAALDDMVDKSAWRRPEKETLTPEQLDRFFAVRRRIDAARRRAGPELDRLPRKRVRSLEELKEIPGVIAGVSDVVGAEMDAFVEAGMPPGEYRWVERLVYGRWRAELRRAGTYPVAMRTAAAEVEAARAREADARVRARLKAVADDMRLRTPAPPEGFDAESHALLLARLDDVERWSLDDIARGRLPVGP
ncbi:MAG: hypothetical protein ACHQKZ_05975 [Solirubrobacterales bacterium]|jgi:hypothetical protein